MCNYTRQCCKLYESSRNNTYSLRKKKENKYFFEMSSESVQFLCKDARVDKRKIVQNICENVVRRCIKFTVVEVNFS